MGYENVKQVSVVGEEVCLMEAIDNLLRASPWKIQEAFESLKIGRTGEMGRIDQRSSQMTACTSAIALSAHQDECTW